MKKTDSESLKPAKGSQTQAPSLILEKANILKCFSAWRNGEEVEKEGGGRMICNILLICVLSLPKKIK